MKILHISWSDGVGGAARSALRLHQGLLAAGHVSRMLVDCKKSSLPTVSSLTGEASLLYKAVNFSEQVSGLQYLVPRPFDFWGHPFLRGAEVVNLHNVHGGFFSPFLLPRLSRSFALVWTLHDMWPFTGHCGYSLDCERWKTGCGKCPDLKSYPPLSIDTTALLWKIKAAVYKRSSFAVVAPSRWLCEKASVSPLLGRFPVHHIPYGVDLEIFRPMDRQEARSRLGLPQELPLVLFGAAFAIEPRKGASLLAQALERLASRSERSVGLVSFGSGSSKLAFPGPFRQWTFETVEDEAKIAALYSAADVFVIPSLADNLPNTALESLACGTPVVAFDAGGISDAVRHLETGYVAACGDVEALAEGIRSLVGDEGLRARLARRCRKVAEQEYALSLQAKRYLDLYNTLLEERGAWLRVREA